MKFKVGQKLEFIEDYTNFKTGEIVTVIKAEKDGVWFENENSGGWAYNKRFKPYKSEKQRIEELEKEVSELKQRVETLEQAEKQRYMVGDTNTYNIVLKTNASAKLKPEVHKTPNQQRKEIIEKAKQFVKDEKENLETHCLVNVKFIENVEKKTVVCLISGRHSKRLHLKGIAKCMKDDVFNIHIGRAIALGRALDEDVSEFVNATKPTEKAVGQHIKIKTISGEIRTHEIIPSDKLALFHRKEVALDSYYASIGTIVDDSEAIY